MSQSAIEKPPLPRAEDPYRLQRERCRSVLIKSPSTRLTPARAKRVLTAAKGRSLEAGMIEQNRQAARAEAAADRRVDRRFRKWLRNLHRRDRNWGIRVRTPKSQRIPMAPKQDKPDRRNTRSLRAYRRPIIDKLGRRGIVLNFEYDGAARNAVGVFRRRVEYPFQSDGVKRDVSGSPVFVSSMGKTPLEICEAADALEGVMRAERANAKICVNATLQLPHDASLEQQVEIVRTFCSEVCGTHDLPFVAVLHKADPAGDQRNDHAHITFAFRQMIRIGDHRWAIGADLRTDLDSPDQFFEYRKIAAEVMTKVMRKAGHNRVYTHLSNADRGLAIIPQKKLTKAQSNQARRGIYVGANEFNAREVARGEQELATLASSQTLPVQAKRVAAAPILRIDPPQRIHPATTSLISKPRMRAIIPPSARHQALKAGSSKARTIVPQTKSAGLPALNPPLVRSPSPALERQPSLSPRPRILLPLPTPKDRPRIPLVSPLTTRKEKKPVAAVGPATERGPLEVPATDRGCPLNNPLPQPRSWLPITGGWAAGPPHLQTPLLRRAAPFAAAIAAAPRAAAIKPLPVSIRQHPRGLLARLRYAPSLKIPAGKFTAPLLPADSPRAAARVALLPSGRVTAPPVVRAPLRPSPIPTRRSLRPVLSILRPAAIKMLDAPPVSSWRSRAMPLLKRRISRSVPTLRPAAAVRAPIAMIATGKSTHLSRFRNRLRHGVYLKPTTSTKLAAVLRPQDGRSRDRIAQISFEPATMTRILRLRRIVSPMVVMKSPSRRTALPAQSKPRCRRLVQLPLPPARAARALGRAAPPKMLRSLRPRERAASTALFASELAEILAARDLLAQRPTVPGRPTEGATANGPRMSLPKENGTSISPASDGSIVDGEELIDRIQKSRTYLVERDSFVLPDDRAAFSRAELQWLEAHQLDLFRIQRDQQIEIERIVAHVDQNIDAYRNERLRVDEDFIAAWNAFADAPAVKKVVEKAAETESVRTPSAETLGALPACREEQHPRAEDLNGKSAEPGPEPTIQADLVPNRTAHAQAAAAASKGTGKE